MASIHSYRGRRGTTYRVFWRTSDGVEHTQTFPSKVEAREWRSTVERFEAAGQTPDPTRGDIRLEVWAGQVVATLHLKPKTVETYASLLCSREPPRVSWTLQFTDLSRKLDTTQSATDASCADPERCAVAPA